MSLVIRADASLAAGTGHLMRCLALAQAWRDRVGPVCFVSKIDSPELARRLEREGMELQQAALVAGSAEDAAHTAEIARQRRARWVVVDGYHLSPSFRALVRGAGVLLLVVDDNGDLGPYDADAVLNQNAHARRQPYASGGSSTRLLLGTEYTLLRRAFLSAPPPRPEVAATAQRLLITMGGADAGNATLQAMAALALAVGNDVECEAILGAANPHRETLLAESAARGLQLRVVQDPTDLAERMGRADAAISAAGATLWELFYFGIPTLAVGLADNQGPAIAHLHSIGALVDGSQEWAASSADFARSIDQLLADGALRTALSRTARGLVDGRGAARVVSALLDLGGDLDDRAS